MDDNKFKKLRLSINSAFSRFPYSGGAKLESLHVAESPEELLGMAVDNLDRLAEVIRVADKEFGNVAHHYYELKKEVDAVKKFFGIKEVA